MIVHVFTAERFHLVPTILRGFLQLEEPQYYLLVRSKKDDRDSVYINLFNEFDNKDFKIVYSFNELKKASDNYKDAKIILHGVPYKWMFFFYMKKFKDVNWICWGGGVRTNLKNWKSVIIAPIRKIMYGSFNKVGVLMPQDATLLQNSFGLKNISLLSYFGSVNTFPYKEEDLLKIKDDPKESIRVYLGNNSSCIKSYISLCNELAVHKNGIEINCMLNYSFKENESSQKLREVGTEIYQNKFNMDTKLYPLNEYYVYMDLCDIYICDMQKQTGLGAIFTCLRLGKKIFLSGANYEWMVDLGCKVYHVNDIKAMKSEEFMKEISDLDKIKNFRIVTSYLDRHRIIGDWNSFFYSKK